MIKLIKPIIDPENIVVEYSSLPFANNGRWGLFKPQVHDGINLGFIYIHPRMTDKQKLRIASHEAIHIAYPQLNEPQTIMGADILTDVIWKAGFRKIK